MAKTVLGNSGPQFNWTGAGAQAWVPFHFSAIQQITAGEADLQHRMGHAGVFADLTAVVSAWSRGTNSHVKLRVNGVDTALDLPINATGAFSDHVNTASVAVDDLVSLVYENGSGGGNFTVSSAALTFEATSGALVTIFGASGSGNFSAGYLALSGSSLTRYVSALVGFGNQGNSVSDGESEIPLAGTISYLQMNVQSNTRTGAFTVTLQINGVDTALTFTVPAGATGKFGDFTHTVAVAAGDRVNLQIDMAASSGTANVVSGSFEVEWDSATDFPVMCANKINGFDAWGTDSYASAIGGGMADSGTILQRQTAWPIACDLIEFICYSDTTTGDITTTLNVNGSDTAFSVTRPGGAGGSNRLSYSATTLTVAAGDLFTYHHVRAGSSTNGFGAAYLIAQVAAGAQSLAPPATAVEIRSGGTPVFHLSDPPQTLSPGVAGLEIRSGGAPSFGFTVGIAPDAGGLQVRGASVDWVIYGELKPQPAGLQIRSGGAPSFKVDVSLKPATGSILVGGPAPNLTLPRVSQAPVLVVADVVPDARVSQGAVLVVAEIIPPSRVFQNVVLAVAEIIPPVAVEQCPVLVVADGFPCTTQLAQVWLIDRTDGVQYAFTSHDEPLLFLGRTATPCNSLEPTAAEGASELGAIGNMELTGVLSDESISAEDLDAGKFDGAYVQAWLVSWDGDSGVTPRRLAAGKIGSVSHGRDGFKGEILGLGAQMQQQAITEVVTPTCAWRFGDSRCTKDLAALTVSGTVSARGAPGNQRTFAAADIAGASPAPDDDYFAFGTVTFTSGPNNGVQGEVKTYDAATGVFELWTPLPHRPGLGDTFDATPGCDLSKNGAHGCAFWSNVINFGGFAEVPGEDAIAETPDAKY